jgi:hypothetical protein
MGQALRFARRRLRRNPSFTAAAAPTLLSTGVMP